MLLKWINCGGMLELECLTDLFLHHQMPLSCTGWMWLRHIQAWQWRRASLDSLRFITFSKGWECRSMRKRLYFYFLSPDKLILLTFLAVNYSPVLPRLLLPFFHTRFLTKPFLLTPPRFSAWHLCAFPPWLPGATWMKTGKWICQELRAGGTKARKGSQSAGQDCTDTLSNSDHTNTRAHTGTAACNSGMQIKGEVCTWYAGVRHAYSHCGNNHFSLHHKFSPLITAVRNWATIVPTFLHTQRVDTIAGPTLKWNPIALQTALHLIRHSAIRQELTTAPEMHIEATQPHAAEKKTIINFNVDDIVWNLPAHYVLAQRINHMYDSHRVERQD